MLISRSCATRHCEPCQGGNTAALNSSSVCHEVALGEPPASIPFRYQSSTVIVQSSNTMATSLMLVAFFIGLARKVLLIFESKTTAQSPTFCSVTYFSSMLPYNNVVLACVLSIKPLTLTNNPFLARPACSQAPCVFESKTILLQCLCGQVLYKLPLFFTKMLKKLCRQFEKCVKNIFLLANLP